MNKTVYLIPGYGGKPLDRESKKLAKFFADKWIKPIHVKINWKSKKLISFQSYVDEFLKQYKKKKGEEVYVFGFSFGANIAVLSAPKTKPDVLILCSLSPFFEEDFATNPEKWTKWWRKTFAAPVSFNKPASLIKTKTLIFAGDKEGPEVLLRSKIAKEKIKDSILTVIKGAKHNIIQKEYIAELEKFVSKLK